MLVKYLSHERLLCHRKSSREGLNASKEQLCLEVYQVWLFTWENGSCFSASVHLAICISFCWCYWTYQKGVEFFILPCFWGCLTTFSLSYSQVGQSVTLDIWKNGSSKSGSVVCRVHLPFLCGLMSGGGCHVLPNQKRITDLWRAIELCMRDSASQIDV